MVSETAGGYALLSPTDHLQAEGAFPYSSITAHFKRHGAVILRGFAKTHADLLTISNRLAPGQERGVVPSDNGLEFHGELYFAPFPPDVIWFYCPVPAKTGGQTLLCDGVRVAADLQASTLAFFSENHLVYERVLTPPLWEAYFGCNTEAQVLAMVSRVPEVTAWFEQGDLHTSFRTPALRTTRWGGEPAFINSLLHAIDSRRRDDIFDYGLRTHIPEPILAETRRLTEKHAYPIEWQSHDIVMIDNSRVMHGRRPFQGRREVTAINGRAAFE